MSTIKYPDKEYIYRPTDSSINTYNYFILSYYKTIYVVNIDI